jgi:cytochrome bd ubiquinol oxidase subunit I
MIPLPFVAVLCGWFVTEVGRQPYLLYGLITVQEGVTPSLTGGMALFTLIGYIAGLRGGVHRRHLLPAPDRAPWHGHAHGIPAIPRRRRIRGGGPKRPLSAAEMPLDADRTAPTG